MGTTTTASGTTRMRRPARWRRWRSTVVAVAVLLASSAVPREASAFRTGSDLPELAGTERVRWADGVIPYVLHDASPAGLSLEQTEDVVTKGIASWTGLACGGPSFAYQGVSGLSAAPNDGINTIEVLTSGWLAHGFAPDAAATTDVQYAKDAEGHWRIIETDIYLNADLFQWKLTTPDGPNDRDLSSVVTHEAGHALGLLHPCEPSGAEGAPDCAGNASFAETTMYPIYAAAQASLADDDVAGACFLYPTPACEQTGCSAGLTCTPGGCRAICAGTACAEGEVCTPAGCDDLLGTCERDADCTAGLHCEGGRCLPGVLPAGDPCTAPSNCASGLCGPGGSCQAPCASDADCAGTQACTPLGDAEPAEGGVCDGRPLGASCEHAGQCLGGECLASAASSPVCTRACDPANAVHAACPSGWECRSVGPRLVCAPLSPADDGGCSTAAARSREAPDHVEWFVVLSAFLLCARASGSRARRAVSSLSNRAR